MKPARTLVTFLLIISFLSGCATSPIRPQPSENPRLEDHVAYLAQPGMKGRKPRSRGSRLARGYITARFEEAGLQPLAGLEGFEQPVYAGTNIIGVLPGSEAALAGEFVLISAHYDHLGRGYPGACDNASGVAALLELVERFSAAPPPRSLCFAAFDCEEEGLFGSFAFTLQEEFDPDALVAVVNMDMLGRDLLEVVDRSLVVSGTQGYPETARFIAGACEANRMRFMPFGGDFIGPRSDNAAFLDCDVPNLFFTCGVFKGYHSKEDTIDCLNFDALRASTDVVAQVVKKLATEVQIEPYKKPDRPDRDELIALSETLAGLREKANELEFSAETRKTLDKIQRETVQPCLEKPYTFSQRNQLAKSVAGLMKTDVGSMVMGGPVGEGDYLFGLTWLFNARPKRITRAYRGLVAHVLERRPVPVVRRMRPYVYEALMECAPSLTRHDNGNWEFVHAPFTVKAEFRFRWYDLDLGGNAELFSSINYCYGSPEEVIDYLFLNMSCSQEEKRQVYRKALSEAGVLAGGADPDAALEDWVRRRGFETTSDWTLSSLRSCNRAVAKASCCALTGEKSEARTPAAMAVVKSIAQDQGADPLLRVSAVQVLAADGGEDAAETLSSLTSDSTVIRFPFRSRAFDDTRAFYDTAAAALFRTFPEDVETRGDTLGDYARRCRQDMRRRKR